MKTSLIIIGVIIALIAGAWFFFGSPQYKKYIEKGKELERYRLQVFYDSISYANLEAKTAVSEKLTDSLLSQNKAISGTLVKVRAYYEHERKSLHGLTDKEIDSLYRLYADNNLTALEKFISLEECDQVVNLISEQLANLEKVHSTDQELISELERFIKSDKDQTIQLRNEVAELQTNLAISNGKLHRRTTQRNVTWLGLGVLVAGYVILR